MQYAIAKVNAEYVKSVINTESQRHFGTWLSLESANDVGQIVLAIVLEYTKEAMVNLSYEKQLSISKENVRVKKDGRTVTTQVTHETPEQMIIFDELEPQVAGMEGLFQYYVPSGREMAYVFVNGRWELREDAQGRLTDKKLNKEFKPIEKKKPAYQTIDSEQ